MAPTCAYNIWKMACIKYYDLPNYKDVIQRKGFYLEQHVCKGRHSIPDQCRYSWNLYCSWNLGIWQRNLFSHPNSAEVVYVKVTPRNGKINANKSCYLVLILDTHSKRLLFSFMSYPDVNTFWKLSALLSDKKISLNQQDTCKYSPSSNHGILEYRDFIFVCEYQLKRVYYCVY